MSRKKHEKEVLLTPEQLAEIEWEYITWFGKLAELYHEARLASDTAKAKRIWHYWCAEKRAQHEFLFTQKAMRHAAARG